MNLRDFTVDIAPCTVAVTADAPQFPRKLDHGIVTNVYEFDKFAVISANG